jgi:hypothetical protein
MKKITMFILVTVLVNLVLIAMMILSAIGSIFTSGMGMNFMEWIEFILTCNGFIFIVSILYLVYKIAKYILK